MSDQACLYGIHDFGATGACRSCGRLAPGLVASTRVDGGLPPPNPVRVLSDRAEGLRSSLQELHDEVCRYLRTRDLEVDELPSASPLRRAIERAREKI